MIVRMFILVLLVAGCSSTKKVSTPEPNSQSAELQRDLVVAEESEGSMIPVVAYWDLGETHTLEVVKGKRKFKNGQLVNVDSSVTNYEIVVVDSTEESYVVRWSAQSVDQSALIGKLEGVNLDLSMFSDIEESGMVIKTSEMGEYQELVNADELVTLTATMVDSLFAHMLDAESGLENLRENEDAMQAAKSMLESLSSPEVIESKLTETAQLYYMWYGYEYQTDGQITYEDALPNFFGGEPIPAEASLEITAIDWEQSLMRLTNTLNPDPVHLKNMLKNLFAGMETPDGTDMNEEIEKLGINIYDTNHYVIDFEWGLVLAVDRVRNIESGEDREEQFLKMTLLN